MGCGSRFILGPGFLCARRGESDRGMTPPREWSLRASDAGSVSAAIL